ncbi:MAG TPA: SprT family zinc-dependent metalloprotease [Nitrososphaeraceae archaeon]|nr:SprT family zinc-dependent metalloprotease [Nitrososphaeraceae archaeon]
MNSESWINVALSDNSIACIKWIRSKRRKHLCITVDRQGISVLSSMNEKVESIRNFVSVNNIWILKKIKYYLKLNSSLDHGPLQRDELTYLGKKYKIQFIKDSSQYSVLSENLMKITFHVKDRRKHKENIKNWYHEQTKKILDIKVPLFGKQLSISYGKVRIKNQKLRWGSCSKHSNLNFNLLLSALPSHIIDYIIVHELIHLIEFNHSEHFWRLVEETFPAYKDCRYWLKKNGPYIQLN